MQENSIVAFRSVAGLTHRVRSHWFLPSMIAAVLLNLFRLLQIRVALQD